MKRGMGWLGWTENETLNASIENIYLAYEGKREMLKAIYGGGEEGKEVTPSTPEEYNHAMKAFFGGLSVPGRGNRS